MKKLFVSTLMLFALAVCAFAQTNSSKIGSKSVPVNFQRFESYFENNNSGLKGDKSFLTATSQNQFDMIFGSAAVMGQNSFLPENVFTTSLVVAAIKRGAMRTYSDVKVMAENGKLFVWYTAKDAAPSSATYSSPLILAVAKSKYKEIVFMENGKKAGSVKITGR